MLKILQSLKGKLYKLSCFYLITPGCSEYRGKNFKQIGFEAQTLSSSLLFIAIGCYKTELKYYPIKPWRHTQHSQGCPTNSVVTDLLTH